MKTFKDLEFEHVPSIWDIKKSVTQMGFKNGYGVKIYRTEYPKTLKRCFEVHIIENGECRRESAINKCGYEISESDITQLMINIQQLKSTTMVRTALMKWQKQLAKLDRTKKVRFDYKVYDCEHDGDMSYAEMECNDFCREYGGEVVLSYWTAKIAVKHISLANFLPTRWKMCYLQSFLIQDSINFKD